MVAANDRDAIRSMSVERSNRCTCRKTRCSTSPNCVLAASGSGGS